ncbi:MAG: hypothetical protein K8H85_06855 [Cyclobacteriaceae bacterium]|nr:hypothetical protein [Cyclobacteriaceae bacterium]
MKTIIPILFILVFAIPSVAQTQEQKIQEFEMQRQAAETRAYNVRLDSAIQLYQSGEYLLADTQFRQLLRSAKSVPSDLVYYFGENSFHLGNFKQSVDWLNKYIQLKGTTGQFSALAVERLKSAEEGLMKEKVVESQQARQVLSQDYDIDCGPTGKVTCPVCKGSTVIIKKGYVSDTYKTCPYCNKLGYLQCEDYNLLLKGQLEPSTTNP